MRGRKPDKSSKKQSPASTPLDEKRRRLEEEQARVRREVANKERLIKEAPKLKEAAEKRRREELVTRASRTEARTPGSLLDPRHSFEANVGAMVRTRKLRREKTQGMWTFFMLCLVLGGIVYWIYAVVIRGLNQ
jgi:hypothetical protein